MLIARPLLRYADFKGRARRAELVVFGMLHTFLLALCAVLAIGPMASGDLETAIRGVLLASGLAGLVCAALLAPSLAVLARRLHDSGKSAKLIALLIPGYLSPLMMVFGLVGALQTAGPDAGDSAMALVPGSLAGGGLLGALAGVCNLIVLILSLLPGTRGPNRYGPDPRDPASVGVSGGGSALDSARIDEMIARAKAESAPQPPPPVMSHPTTAPVFGRRGAA